MNRALRHVAVATAVVAMVVLCGCSAEPPVGTRMTSPVVVTSGSGPAAVGSAGAGSGFSSRPSMPLVATSGAPAAAIGGMAAPPPNTQATTTSPRSLDKCGAGNTAGLNDAQIKTLMMGGAPGSMRWLYPYDGTVFPRGMLAPTLMWDGADGKAVYVHIQSKRVEYRGC